MLTTYADQKILNTLMQAASLGNPATWYVGLLGAATWQASTAYSSGTYVVPTTFGSIPVLNPGRIWKCTTAGTSGSTQPTWGTTAGATNTDGTATWTEVTNLFQAGTFTGAELSGSSYARVAVTANSTNFSSATSAQPSTCQNAVAINFSSPTGSAWEQAVGFIYADASTGGNIWIWGGLTASVVAGVGSSPSIAVGGYTLSLE